MEEQARKRKERLQALRAAKLGEGKEENVKPTLKFRNYDPLNSEFQASVAPVEREKIETVEKQVDGLTEAVLEEEQKKMKEELDLANLAPKKPNWDLKRDVEKQLNRLEKKTKASIAELIRIRLKGDKTSDLVGAVNAVNEQQQNRVDSDDEEA
ncbi:mRNA splicing factor [Basidiobolus meristosporus CBS 931.73]|uniref:mRNA splicing factor n=1 Tax=Basidiobolus meristosporus CBS 931.73 TaxID=1314790 RepID=A0A1Y1Y2W0_9FUNG|nr:mRNA splicing factor [Basidiobolus meristosporus CBS 931.73]|eukprot:ORX92333.1 mRNA splicing factor [Basidiobolus meristosporus CBS 931.73]